MNRRNFLAVAGGAGLAAAATGGMGDLRGVGTADHDGKLRNKDLHNGSFEDGFTFHPWTVGRDLPTDVATGREVAASAGIYSEFAADGVYALSLSIDGRHDDGTGLVQQAADLEDVDTSPSPRSTRRSRSTPSRGSPSTPGRDLTEAEFDTTRAVEDHAGWKAYEYPVDYDETGLVAVGSSVVRETYVRRLLDDVRLF